ncbi:MTPC1 [Symbiodinium natans]|uniref:MTPC1 protein n=1 Tax=Symbiodinium natans TaxID=878477 RepID=A0A812ID47_9DINO|nr:MTPC1 [Symbiodinium natans]
MSWARWQRFTFIDNPKTPVSPVQARARSCPPSARRRHSTDVDMPTDVHPEKHLACERVGRLNPKLGDTNFTETGRSKAAGCFRTDACLASTTAPDPEEEFGGFSKCSISLDKRVWPSYGTLGHPDVCGRPCIFVLNGSCERGAACACCHRCNFRLGGVAR